MPFDWEYYKNNPTGNGGSNPSRGQFYRDLFSRGSSEDFLRAGLVRGQSRFTVSSGSQPMQASASFSQSAPNPFRASSEFGRTMNSPTLGRMLGAAAYGYSLVDRIGQDPSMIQNVVFPGVVGAGVSQGLQSRVVGPMLSKLGEEGVAGFYRSGEGAAARTFFNGARANVRLPGLGPLIMGLDAWNSVGQAGSADPTRAALGRSNMAYGGGYVVAALAAGALGIGGLTGVGLAIAGGMVLGGVASEMMQASRYEKATMGSINALNASQKAFTYGAAPNLPTKLNAFQTAATGVSLYLDTFMAGGAMVYDFPARMLGAPTASDVRGEFGKMSVDSASLSGEFKGMSFGQAKSAFIGAALAPNVLQAGSTTTYADTLDWKGGVSTFVKDQLSHMYQEGKALGMSERQIRGAQVQAGATAYANLSQRAVHEQNVINNMTASSGRGLFGDYKPMAYKQNNAVQNAVQSGWNAVAGAVHSAANWMTGPLSSMLAQPGIKEKIAKREQTVSGRNYAAAFLAGQGVKPSAMIAGASPAFLAAAFRGAVGSVGGGGGYGNAGYAASQARYAKMDAERAARERSDFAGSQHALEIASIPDVPYAHFNASSMRMGVSHVSGGLEKATGEMNANYQDKYGDFKELAGEYQDKWSSIQKARSSIMGDKSLSPTDRNYKLAAVEDQTQKFNLEMKNFTGIIKEAGKAQKAQTKELKESAEFLVKQNSENLNRSNYQLTRDIYNNKKADLLDRKTMGLISGQRFISESFALKRWDEQSQYASLKQSLGGDQAEYDQSVKDFAFANGGVEFDPNGTYSSGTMGYNLQQQGRELSVRGSRIAMIGADFAKNHSIQAENRAHKRALSTSIQKGLQPFTTQFFGSLGRGNSFGDSIRSLQLPFMQSVGGAVNKLLSNGLANVFSPFVTNTASEQLPTYTAGSALPEVASPWAGAPIEDQAEAIKAQMRAGIGGGAAPIGNYQRSVAPGNMNQSGGIAGVAPLGLMAGVSGLFKSTGGIAGMASRFFGKGTTASIASTLATKGGIVGKLAGNFAKNGGMGFGSLAAFGNLLGGAVGSIGGSILGRALAPEHYGNTGGSIGSAVGGTAGAILGTAVAGPVGALVGGFLGSLIGGGIGGFFGGGSGKKAAKEQAAAAELHAKTMSVFAPKVKKIMGEIDPFSWDSLEEAKNKLRGTSVRGREQTAIRRTAYNDIASIKSALLPYKDLSDKPGGIAGNLFENRVRGEMAQNAYGAFSSQPTRELYSFYSQVQSQLSELDPKVRGTYKSLSQQALTSQYNYQNQALNLQISRGNTNYGFDVRASEINSRDRAINYDQASHNFANFDRDTQRSLESVMGVTQRRGNRSAIASELLTERSFQKGIAERQLGVLGDSNALQSDQSNFNLSTALEDLGYLSESQRNLTTEYNKLLPVIGDVNDELLRLLSSIKDVNDALKKL